MIYFPKALAEAIYKNIGNTQDFNVLKLRNNYQANIDHQQLHATYLASRMPATYAAILRVLQEISKDTSIKTILDIGSGPGTALWAIREHFLNIESYLGLEADSTFVEIAKRLNSQATSPHIQWLQGQYPKDLPTMPADLVLMAYTLGENSEDNLTKTIDHIWNNNMAEWLVVIEPGTSKGFKVIADVRNHIIRQGGFIYAPCKGNYLCPLSATDWCHFSTRLERIQLQRHAKKGTLAYEDEKFSYLIARKTPVVFEKTDARIIKKPIIRPEHITLDLCNQSGYERRTISKSQKETYRAIKQTEWGDSF
jgi:ribosomal protein RSM22 (predicted rRNA methylase)